MTIRRNVLALGAFLPAIAIGQAMTEYAVSAAGSTAGAAAAKKLQPSVTNVFSKLDVATKKAADQGAARKSLIEVGITKEIVKKEAAVETPRPLAVATASRPAPAVKQPPRDSASYDPGVPEPPASVQNNFRYVAVLPPPRPLIRATPETLAQIAVGNKRSDVVTRLGAPASKISMVEDGKLTEIYRYTAAGRTLGTVRLANGEVTQVEVR
ncbi:MAG: hypothetical protein K2X35_03620 [Bryobacteraceae bacterium]|nr:hypothetical protein [Bryobacteraceae bacterium]